MLEEDNGEPTGDKLGLIKDEWRLPLTGDGDLEETGLSLGVFLGESPIQRKTELSGSAFLGDFLWGLRCTFKKPSRSKEFERQMGCLDLRSFVDRSPAEEARLM